MVPMMFLGNRLLIAVYPFEAPPVYYTIAPDGTGKKKADIGSFDGNMTCISMNIIFGKPNGIRTEISLFLSIPEWKLVR